MSEELFQRITKQYPDYTPLCTKLVELKNKKLYFQLTNEIITFVNDPFLFTLQMYREFYDVFIHEIQNKIAPIKFIQIISKIAKQYADPNEAMEFLQSIYNIIEIDLAARCLFYVSQAEILIHQNKFIEAKDLLQTAQNLIANEEGIESIVYSELYRITAEFYQCKQNPNLYYQNAVMYLKYVDINSLEIDNQLLLAKTMMISSLLGENVFDFASFLNSPIAKHFESNEIITGSSHNMNELKLLYVLVSAINNGNMTEFTKTLEGLGSLFASDKILAENIGKIREKASLVCLMELIFRTQSTKRTFSFATISEITQVPLNKVEIVVMRAMNLGLVKGFIDQCKQEVSFTWVMPRVLDKNQFAFVKQQLDQWEQQTRKTLELVSMQE